MRAAIIPGQGTPVTQPITSVVRVAATTSQAKILVAQLQAAGIPAFVEGDSLADEVAVSRRMLNLNGTRVMVPTQSLAAAREVLAEAQVPVEDLEAQAIGAEDPETPPMRRAADGDRAASRWPLLLTSTAAVGFAILWLGEIGVRAGEQHPYLVTERIPSGPRAGGLRERRLADGVVVHEYEDRAGIGAYDTVIGFHPDDQRSEAVDRDHDGWFESCTYTLRRGFTCEWSDTDHDGLLDRALVRDGDGREVQELRWVDGKGFVLQPR